MIFVKLSKEYDQIKLLWNVDAINFGFGKPGARSDSKYWSFECQVSFMFLDSDDTLDPQTIESSRES